MTVKPVRKVIVVSVGFRAEKVRDALIRVGVGIGDAVILVNSVPKAEEAVKAMNMLSEWIRNIHPEIAVESLWLDPRDGFEKSVAVIRRAVERFSPCRAVFMAIGGFRWLSIAITFAATATKAVGRYRGVEVMGIEVELEEEASRSQQMREMFPTQESRVVKVHTVPPIAWVLERELKILEAISKGYDTLKKLSEYQLQENISRETIRQKLIKLMEKGLIAVELRGRTKRYRPTPLAEMLI